MLSLPEGELPFNLPYVVKQPNNAGFAVIEATDDYLVDNPKEAYSEYHRFKEWINKVTYKPTMQIIWSLEPKANYFTVRIRVATYDSRPSIKPVDTHVHGMNSLSRYTFAEMNIKTFMSWLGDCLLKLEEHEFQEWYRIDGQ